MTSLSTARAATTRPRQSTSAPPQSHLSATEHRTMPCHWYVSRSPTRFRPARTATPLWW